MKSECVKTEEYFEEKEAETKIESMEGKDHADVKKENMNESCRAHGTTRNSLHELHCDEDVPRYGLKIARKMQMLINRGQRYIQIPKIKEDRYLICEEN